MVVEPNSPVVDDWDIPADDPAFKAGYKFVEDNVHRADAFAHKAPMWFGWMVRTAFWAGVKWQRDYKAN